MRMRTWILSAILVALCLVLTSCYTKLSVTYSYDYQDSYNDIERSYAEGCYYEKNRTSIILNSGYRGSYYSYERICPDDARYQSVRWIRTVYHKPYLKNYWSPQLDHHRDNKHYRPRRENVGTPTTVERDETNERTDSKNGRKASESSSDNNDNRTGRERDDNNLH